MPKDASGRRYSMVMGQKVYQQTPEQKAQSIKQVQQIARNAGPNAIGLASYYRQTYGTGEGGGGGGGGHGGGSAPPALTSTKAQAPGEIGYGVKGLKELLAGGPEEQRSIDRLGSGVREFVHRGQQAMTPGQVARGVTGTGVQGRQYRNVEAEGQRLFAGGAADIEMDRLDKRQGIYRDIIGAGATRAGIAQGDKGLQLSMAELQLRRWEAEQANQRAAEAAKLAQINEIVNLAGGFPPAYGGPGGF